MSRKRFPLYLLCAVALSAGGACTSASDGKPQPQLTLEHIQPVSINVSAVNVVDNSTGVLQDFIVSPHDLMRSYWSRRFQAAGHGGSLRIVIEQSNVQRSRENSSESVARFFNVGKFDVYNVELKMTLEHLDDGGFVIFSKTLSAQRAVKITEHASIAEREKHQLSAIEEMVRGMDQRVLQIVQDEMRLRM